MLAWNIISGFSSSLYEIMDSELFFSEILIEPKYCLPEIVISERMANLVGFRIMFRTSGAMLRKGPSTISPIRAPSSHAIHNTLILFQLVLHLSRHRVSIRFLCLSKQHGWLLDLPNSPSLANVGARTLLASSRKNIYVSRIVSFLNFLIQS